MLVGWLVSWLVCCCIWLVGWLAGWLLLAHTQPIAVLARYKEKYAGWAQKKTRQTPLLNEAHRAARLEYVEDNEDEDFRRRAMIDEKIFEDAPPADMNVPTDVEALKLRMGEQEEPEDGDDDETNAADLAHSDEEQDEEEEEADEQDDEEEEEADLGTPEKKKKKTKASPAHQPVPNKRHPVKFMATAVVMRPSPDHGKTFDGKVGIWPSKVEFKTAM